MSQLPPLLNFPTEKQVNFSEYPALRTQRTKMSANNATTNTNATNRSAIDQRFPADPHFGENWADSDPDDDNADDIDHSTGPPTQSTQNDVQEIQDVEMSPDPVISTTSTTEVVDDVDMAAVDNAASTEPPNAGSDHQSAQPGTASTDTHTQRVAIDL